MKKIWSDKAWDDYIDILSCKGHYDYINPLMNSSASATGAPFLSSEIASMQDFFMIKPIS